ncbi:MAG: ATP-binding protein, partial [Armatimonadetes bacterium]|nr:ATP-binding protein [Armatimonadota bacterium]
MRISALKVANVRCIRELSMRIEPLTILIGQNNCGKSSVLYALRFFFESAGKLEPGEFFNDGEAHATEAYVELSFCDLDDQDRTTFRKYVLPDGTFTVRKTCYLQDSGTAV